MSEISTILLVYFLIHTVFEITPMLFFFSLNEEKIKVMDGLSWAVYCKIYRQIIYIFYCSLGVQLIKALNCSFINM